MTEEDKELIGRYMNWEIDQGVWRLAPNGDIDTADFDLNDAGLCVAEMQKRGDIFDFYSYLIDIYNELVEQGTVICGADNFTAWLFIADNFFGAMAAWLNEVKK